MRRDFSPGVTVVEESLPGVGLVWVVWPATWPGLFGYVDPAEYRRGTAIAACQWWRGRIRAEMVTGTRRVQRLMARRRR